MTPADFLAFRTARGLTQEDLGREFGYTGRHVRNWESGKTAIPVAVEKLIEMMKEAEK